jgi:protein involved in polysaccharide export with SLBB domain
VYQAVAGAMALIAVRQITKREIGAELTMIVATRNNPLKFLPTPEAAMMQILGPRMPGFMAPMDSMADAFEDLRAHEVGVIAGTRAAFTEVLRRFDPKELEQRLGKGGVLDGIVPGLRDARLWELFVARFQEVYKDAQLSQTVQIRPDGKITLPLVGDLVAAGQTPLALGNSIATFLKENQYIASPVVTVIVVETQPPTISVMGEVNSPGPQQLRGQLSIIEALAAAGGFKDFANTKNIIVQRATKSGVQRIKFNYNDAIKQEGKPFYLQAGDIVIVP